MKAKDARRYTLEKVGVKRELVKTPFWPELDGHVYMEDIPTDELLTMEHLKKAPNGDLFYIGALLCKALVVEDEGRFERMYEETDRELVVKLGGSVLGPIFLHAQTFYGTGSNAVQAAKNG